MREIHGDFGIQARMGDAFPLCLLPHDDWGLVTGCWQGTGFGQISYTGDVKSCSILGGSYGNVFETPMVDIWTERLRTMRSLTHLPLQCRLCPHFCGGGCSASRFGASAYAPDEFIPKPGEETILSLAKRVPGYMAHLGRNAIDRWNSWREDKRDDRSLPSTTARPTINCRFRLRKDLDGYIGFFEGRGILTLNETAARIVRLIDGRRSIEDIILEMQRGRLVQNERTRKETRQVVLDFLQSINRGEFLVFSESSSPQRE